MMDNLNAREILRSRGIEVGTDTRSYDEIIGSLVIQGIIKLEEHEIDQSDKVQYLRNRQTE